VLTQQLQEPITDSAQTMKVQKYDMHNQIIITETAPANITALLLLLLLLLLVLLQLLFILIQIIYKKSQTISRMEKVSSRELLF
jgi:hypothetical protein